MIDIVEIENKIRFTVLYKNSFCSFVPHEQKELKELPDLVDGLVIYPEIGEYNPNSWAKPLKIKKEFIFVKEHLKNNVINLNVD